MGKLHKLKVWKKGKGLAVFIYRISHNGLFAKDHDTRDQISRATVFIPGNIAEGDELGMD